MASALQLPPQSASPSGQVLALLSTLSNPSSSSSQDAHARHALALKARDDALSSSNDSYSNLCTEFCRVLCCQSPELLSMEVLKEFHDSLAGDTDMFHKFCGWIQNNGGNSNAQRDQGMMMWNTLRQMAGLLLKNALVSPPPPSALVQTKRMKLSLEAATEIKHGLLRCLTDALSPIRGVASTAIARCCTAAVYLEKSMGIFFSVGNWVELVPFILHCVQIGNTTQQTSIDSMEQHAGIGALVTLRKLLEDIPNRVAAEAPSTSFHELVPALLTCLQSPIQTRRKEALACLNVFIFPMPGSLVANMDRYLGGLSALASDESAEIRQLVCQGIVSLLSQRAEYIKPHFASIVTFMLTATSDSDPSVALEACDFWLTFASLDEDSYDDEMMGCVAQSLPQLLPVLLKGMVYPPDKIEELLEDNAIDERGGDDRQQDLAPVFHSAKTKGQYDSDDDDSEGGGSDDEMDDDDGEWSLRKCSAASLDSLAGIFGASYVLPPLLPALQEGLRHSDQWFREASILALGAISDGCMAEITPHLPQLHPFLLSQLTSQDSLPQLRCISAWALGRYASWTVTADDPSLVACSIEALVGRLLDRNKKVQVATCSALGVYVEAAGDLMTPYLEPVYRALMEALQLYRTRSILCLFDTLGVMADNVGAAIGEGPLPGMYVPPILKRWNDIGRENPMDRSLLPLMECLGSITVVCGMNYQPWAVETFEMAMSTIEGSMLIISHYNDISDVDDELADPMICAIDLIDGLIEGLGSNFATLVAGSARFGPTFPNLLQQIVAHDIPGVRISAFAVLGDLARQAPTLIEAGLPTLLSEAISSIDPMHPAVCNNSLWALGEICVRCGENAGPLTPNAADLLQNLIPLLMGNSIDIDGNPIDTPVPGIVENAAITLGRLACVNPSFVAPELGRFLLGWCDGLSKISNPTERKDAFSGFILALRANPHSIQNAGPGLSQTIGSILFAVVSWHVASDDLLEGTNVLHSNYGFQPFPGEFVELKQLLTQLLTDIKASAGQESWNQAESQMPVNVKRLMKEVYNV
eukprot:scaffold34593_cov122-Skeletonema_dohrnii-CCMP3373.AAC.5